MDQRIILADGTTYENGGCGESEGLLYCNIRGEYEFVSVLHKFTNTQKIETIRFQAGDIEDVFTGYTKLKSIAQISDTYIAVVLKRGET